ncbi:DUF4064 domain-containing protein [Peribacillus sp. SCS-155]|uniref:DUF4064 domain-containing protein n=1 Tax=Peribacillus sedimenti TaxID=3115297 RepID=UPI00390614AE
MKRTAEIVLTVIGIVLNVIMIAFAGILTIAFKDNALQSELERELEKDPNLQAANVDVGTVMNFMEGLGWGFVAIVVVSTVLAVIAAFAFRKNRRPKLAGGLLIASTLIVGIGTILIGWLPALLYLIAGIMAFVRKPKTTADF